MIEKREFYINGAWVSPVDGKLHQVINPATEEACAVVEASTMNVGTSTKRSLPRDGMACPRA